MPVSSTDDRQSLGVADDGIDGYLLFQPAFPDIEIIGGNRLYILGSHYESRNLLPNQTIQDLGEGCGEFGEINRL